MEIIKGLVFIVVTETLPARTLALMMRLMSTESCGGWAEFGWSFGQSLGGGWVAVCIAPDHPTQ